MLLTRIKIGECSLSQKGKKERDQRQKPTKRHRNKKQKAFLFLRHMHGVFSIIYIYVKKEKIVRINIACQSNVSMVCNGFFDRSKKEDRSEEQKSKGVV